MILSAGSIGTPQILLLSGIGSPSQLAKLGIDTLVRLDDVGAHLQDHPFVPFQWSVTNNKTFDFLSQNQTAFLDELENYKETKSGLFANNAIANNVGFFRLPNSSSILSKYEDPSPGGHSAHYELIFCVCSLCYRP